MHKTALRSLYNGSSHAKTKSVAVVSPVVDDVDDFEERDLSAGEEGNGFGRVAHSLAKPSHWGGITMSENASVSLKIHDVPEDGAYQLQAKSAALGRLGVTQIWGSAMAAASNQELEAFAGQHALPKRTVLGQKQQWRRSRAQRSRQHLTISPVQDDERNLTMTEEGGAYGMAQGSIISRATGSYRESQSHGSRASIGRDSLLQRSENSVRESDSPSQTPSSYSSSESSSTSEGSQQRFVVTRQRKSKFSAKLHLPGQNPLYLGRYKNEEAALAACESALSTLSTPRK